MLEYSKNHDFDDVWSSPGLAGIIFKHFGGCQAPAVLLLLAAQNVFLLMSLTGCAIAADWIAAFVLSPGSLYFDCLLYS